jgi:excisionase family DNA binding protein
MDRQLSVPDAAKRLGVNDARVRALIAAGDLHAAKIGGRWLLDGLSVARRERDGAAHGRPFEPHNAWAVILIASDENPDWIMPGVRWRLRQLLSLQGIAELRQRLRHRARIRPLRAHPGELRYLAQRRRLARSGVSGAGEHGLGLASGVELDAYVTGETLPRLIDEHALADAEPGEANVLLRAVPQEAWHLDDRRTAPLAAVALDLAESLDSRSARVGADTLHAIDRRVRRQRLIDGGRGAQE